MTTHDEWRRRTFREGGVARTLHPTDAETVARQTARNGRPCWVIEDARDEHDLDYLVVRQDPGELPDGFRVTLIAYPPRWSHRTRRVLRGIVTTVRTVSLVALFLGIVAVWAGLWAVILGPGLNARDVAIPLIVMAVAGLLYSACRGATKYL